ncbi:MAG TPA: Ig-like domain-containing protein [Anaerolineales bacterium]
MNKKQVRIGVLLLTLCLALSAAPLALAQANTLSLRINRIMGYSSLSKGEIQGSFTMEATGPDSLQKVTFLIDGSPMAEVTQAPFKIRFDTGSYNLGVHTLSAVGTTSDGTELRTADYQTKFVTPQEGWQAGLKIAGPLILIILLATLIGMGGPLLLNRGKKLETPLGEQRNYGIRGGAICPQCRRPFVLPIFSMNLGLGSKLARCPYCGKVGLMRRSPLNKLRAAEAAELEGAQENGQVVGLSEEEKLRKELDDSRYQSS